MAQYRELAAFSQFASDLDAKTKAQLDRGMRITEILKQGWDEPAAVIDQIVVFWAVSNSLVDTVKLTDIKAWEKSFLEEIHATNQPLLDSILQEQKLTDKHHQALRDFTTKFNANHPEWQLEQ